MIKVSIIMPAYNCEKTIKKTIDSVLNQDFIDFELIIVNDGSVDKTKDICNEIHDKRVKVIHQKNQGPSAARNNGLRIAAGKYIMFIDSDDIYFPNSVSTLYNAIELYNTDIVTASYKSFDDHEDYKSIKIKTVSKENKTEKYIYILQNKGLLNSNWNKIYKKSIISNNHIEFDKEKEIGEDIRFNFEYFRYAKSFSIISNVIYNYYINNSGLSKKNEETKKERILNLLDYQLDYYKSLNLSTKEFQRIIIKYFFIVYNENDNYFKSYIILLNRISKKIFALRVLEKLINSKRKIIINCLIKIYRKIR